MASAWPPVINPKPSPKPSHVAFAISHVLEKRPLLSRGLFTCIILYGVLVVYSEATVEGSLEQQLSEGKERGVARGRS